MRRFFVPPDKIDNNAAELLEADAHHLRTVMRLRPGDAIVVFDGSGSEYEARIRSIGGKQVRVDLVSRRQSSTDSRLDLVIALGFLKEKKMEDLIRPLSELGVTRLLPVMAQRSVPIPDARRLPGRQARWHKISLEALKQCRRSRPLVIENPLPFDAALRQADPYPLKLLFWENATDPLDPPADQPHPPGVFLLLGPEGGFEPAEVEKARDQGFQIASLGPRILRAETAALTTAALAQHLWGDLGRPQH